MADRFGVRLMTLDDCEPVAVVHARAFFDDPLQVWAFPDAAHRLATLRAMFALQSRHASVPLGCSYTDAARVCAAFWAPPGREHPDAETLAALAPVEDIVGEAVGRLRAAFAAMRDAHPAEPHYYLQGVGTDPSHQGTGRATAVLTPVLRHCDEAGVPAYLESTKERNVGFYERLGFRVTHTVHPPPDGPRLWCMWRAPTSPG